MKSGKGWCFRSAVCWEKSTEEGESAVSCTTMQVPVSADLIVKVLAGPVPASFSEGPGFDFFETPFHHLHPLLQWRKGDRGRGVTTFGIFFAQDPGSY